MPGAGGCSPRCGLGRPSGSERGGAGEQERGHAGVSGIEGLCAGRTMGLLQAQLLTFNSSVPVTPYGIASWKILVESQEQRKDVRLLLKKTVFSRQRKPFGGWGGKEQPEEPGLPEGLEANPETFSRWGSREKGNAQEALPRSAVLVHCLGMKSVCLCGKNSSAASLY